MKTKINININSSENSNTDNTTTDSSQGRFLGNQTVATTVRVTEKKPEKSRSVMYWIAIVIAAYVFFPIAIVIFLYKLRKENRKYKLYGNLVLVVAASLIVFALLCLIAIATGGLSGETADTKLAVWFVTLVMFLLPGILCLRHGMKFRKLGIIYEKYTPIITMSPDGLLDNMAVSINESYNTLCENIQALIDAKILQDTYIDHLNRTLVSRIYQTPSPETQTTVSTSSPKMQAPTRTVKCPNCGATNTVIEGQDGECEYCGSLLQE